MTNGKALFARTWKLLVQESRRADGSIYYPRGKEVVGVVIYDANCGYMSVQIARADHASGDVTEYATALHGFVAYHGSYEVDEAIETITHHVRGCSFPGWIGTDQVRHYRFENDRLILSAEGKDAEGLAETRVLSWQRMG